MEVSEEQIEQMQEDSEQAEARGYDSAKGELEEQYKNPELAAMRQQQEETFNIFRLQNEDWVARVGHELRGEVLEVDKNGLQSWKKKRIAQLNEDGIQLAMSVISMYANKDSYLAYLDVPKIGKICKNINHELAILFGVYRVKYGVLHKDLIVDLICDKVDIVLSRAIKGREADLISKSFSHIQHESFNSPQQRKGGGLLSWLKPRRR